MPVVLPYSVVGDYIRDHPLSLLTRIKPTTIYDVVVEILTVLREPPAAVPPPTADQTPGPVHVDFTCPSCKGRAHVIDYRESNVVCKGCGACVRHTGSYRTYEKDASPHKGGGDHGSVPDWWNAHMSDEERRAWEIQREAKHLVGHPDAMAAMGADELELVTRRARMATRAATSDRVVAAVFVRDILAKVDLDEVAAAVQRGAAIEPLRYVAPRPQFACRKCGASVWNKWEERRHPCEWGRRKRPRSFP